MTDFDEYGFINPSQTRPADSINDGGEDRFNGIANKIFGNSLILGLICSYVRSEADLRNHRLVSHSFQKEATRKLRRVHKEILINNEDRAQSMIRLAKNRNTLKLTPFPFTSFHVYITYSPNKVTVEDFGAIVGPHIARYSFHLLSSVQREYPTKKLVTLLTHSPKLIQLKLVSDQELFFTYDDVNRLPTVFKSLSTVTISATPSISQSDVNHYENSHPPVDVLIIRAPQLNNISISPYSYSLSSRILLLLNERCPRNIQYFSFDVRPHLQTSLGLAMQRFFFERQKAQSLIRGVITLLETQTNTLTHLNLDIFSYVGQAEASFRFPQLQALKKLKLTFPDTMSLATSPYSRYFLPFEGNPFPVLQKLCLEHYREEFALFGPSCSMSSLQTLHLCFQSSSISDPSWSTVFPNLTRLHIEFEPKLAEVYRSTLSYILTHLTRLEHLDLDMTQVENEVIDSQKPSVAWSCWDILTGGAPESFRQLELSGLKFKFRRSLISRFSRLFLRLLRRVTEVGVAEEPVNGIYRVPSLRNMTALKTLRIFPRRRSNLIAIFYMSRVGLLVPLQKLVLSSLERDNGPELTEIEIKAYKEGFLKIHNDVVFWELTQ